ncbi:hypothetical protein ALP29_05240 [Pseudomonas syringae pv. avii]|uniref:Uncharacterized protein n=1 Tax=Pseudomonas syringae pv. avii TaxID=663959 RepID=A0A3M5VKA8_PSESX|nr:hypothetical protein ALP29_05240 [Pseudomonas syringae pv. avii]
MAGVAGHGHGASAGDFRAAYRLVGGLDLRLCRGIGALWLLATNLAVAAVGVRPGFWRSVGLWPAGGVWRAGAAGLYDGRPGVAVASAFPPFGAVVAVAAGAERRAGAGALGQPAGRVLVIVCGGRGIVAGVRRALGAVERLAGVDPASVVDCHWLVSGVAGVGFAHQPQRTGGQSVCRAVDQPGGAAPGAAGHGVVVGAAGGGSCAVAGRRRAGRIVQGPGAAGRAIAGPGAARGAAGVLAGQPDGRSGVTAAQRGAVPGVGLAPVVDGRFPAPGVGAPRTGRCGATGCRPGAGTDPAHPPSHLALRCRAALGACRPRRARRVAVVEKTRGRAVGHDAAQPCRRRSRRWCGSSGSGAARQTRGGRRNRGLASLSRHPALYQRRTMGMGWCVV